MGVYVFADENTYHRRASRAASHTPFLMRADPPPPTLLDLVGPTETWRSRGACVGADHRLFDPASEADRARGVPERARTAARYCAGCPVLESCRESADEYRETGVWAGTWRAGQYGNYRVLPIPLPTDEVA